VGNDDGTIEADPAVLSSTCEALAGAAEHLLSELTSLDDTVTGMLARWQGGAGDSYKKVWTMWHQGADEVEKALATTARLLGHAADVYEAQEQAGVDKLRGVHRG
jgi:WXG100 family type VII secretion target